MITSKLTNQIKKGRGFTIVELLVVIVVIGILAAISIVSYTGITTRANDKAALSNATSVLQFVNVFYADNSVYPGVATDASTYTTTLASFKTPSYWNATTSAAVNYSLAAKLADNITIVAGQSLASGVTAGAVNLSASNGMNSVSIACLSACLTPTGGRIGYWDYDTSAVVYLYYGDATASSATFAIPS